MQVFRQFTPHSFSTATSSLHPHLVHRLIFGDEDLRADFSLRTLAVRSSWFLHPVAGIHRGNQTRWEIPRRDLLFYAFSHTFFKHFRICFSRCVANSRFLENVRVFAASMKAASLVRKCIKVSRTHWFFFQLCLVIVIISWSSLSMVSLSSISRSTCMLEAYQILFF